MRRRRMRIGRIQSREAARHAATMVELPPPPTLPSAPKHDYSKTRRENAARQQNLKPKTQAPTDWSPGDPIDW
jgi:hypothetical protein